MLPIAELYPLFALAFWTLGVAIWLLLMRIKAVKSGTNPAYFKFNQGKLPDYALQAEQHYINLFEMPVLFYVIGIIAYITHSVDSIGVTLAWLYVIARLVHSYIHLTTNQILKRRDAFLASYVCLLLLWLWTGWKVVIA